MQNEAEQLYRKCKFCGLEAKTVLDLEMFKKNKSCKYGREQVCKYCHNEYKDFKHKPDRKKRAHTPWLRKCMFCGLEANTIEELANFAIDKRGNYGRQNVCYKCRYTHSIKPWIEKHRDKKRKSNYYDEDPIKYHCRIASQRLPMKDKCEECGSTEKLERHHPDHSRPKEFKTLCHKCHNALRRKTIVF
jgi:hypothetical protein